MTRAVWLLPLLLALTACDRPAPEPPVTTWLGLADKYAIFIFLLLVILFGSLAGRGRKRP